MKVASKINLITAKTGFYILKRIFFQIYRIVYFIYCSNLGAKDVMRNMWNCAQLIFVAQKMRKFATTRISVVFSQKLIINF